MSFSNTHAKTVLMAAIATLGGVLPVFAYADSDTTSAAITTSIGAELEVSQQEALNFGTFAAGKDGGKVVVDQSGSRVSGSITSLGGGSQAVFSVSGSSNNSFNVSIPQSSVQLTSGSNSMALVLSTSVSSGTLDSEGEGKFYVRGTLEVAPNQRQGVYSGVYSVSVDY